MYASLAATAGIEPGEPHNLLMAPRWMVLVPRTGRLAAPATLAALAASPAGLGAAMGPPARPEGPSADVNGLGFLGCLLVRDPGGGGGGGGGSGGSQGGSPGTASVGFSPLEVLRSVSKPR